MDGFMSIKLRNLLAKRGSVTSVEIPAGGNECLISIAGIDLSQIWQIHGCPCALRCANNAAKKSCGRKNKRASGSHAPKIEPCKMVIEIALFYFAVTKLAIPGDGLDQELTSGFTGGSRH